MIEPRAVCTYIYIYIYIKERLQMNEPRAVYTREYWTPGEPQASLLRD
jgi:hypothetical protein